MLSSRRFTARCIRATVLAAMTIVAVAPVQAFARPGGGGGRGPGGGGPGRPSAGGGVRPGPSGGMPGAGVPGGGSPGRVIEGGPVNGGRVIEGGPVSGARGIEGSVPAGARVAPGRDVETFINAKPAAGAAAGRTAIDPATAKSRAESMKASLEGRTQPFTPAWYAEHPNAWQYTHPYSNWWAVAGVVGLSNWLGYGVYPAGTTSSSTAASSTVSSGTAAAGETSVMGEAAAPPPSDLEWMPLGVYATTPKGAAQAHVYQQLAVSKQGELKGNYYDAISNAVQPVSGSIDRETRKATWTVGTAGGATFETTLDALVKTPSSVTMKSGGSVQEWELVQVENPQGKAATP